MFPSRSTIFALLFTACQVSALVIRTIGGGSGLSRRQSAGEVVTQCTEPNTVALTFDDGPFIYLNEIVDTLTEAGANGTFFFNGNNWGCIYDEANVDRVRYAFENGHQIASHTWSHARLPALSQAELHWEFWLLEEALFKITGAFPRFTRPPFGAFNDDVLEVARFHGQIIANWDFDSLDTDQRGTARVLIPEIVRSLQAAGYRLVTVAECLGVEPYLFQGEPQERDDTWACTYRRRT